MLRDEELDGVKTAALNKSKIEKKREKYENYKKAKEERRKKWEEGEREKKLKENQSGKIYFISLSKIVLSEFFVFLSI